MEAEKVMDNEFVMEGIPTIVCEGTPFEIGFQHGERASEQIVRCIEFYENIFQEKAHLSSYESMEVALRFVPFLEREWPDYLSELKGIAKGAEVWFSQVLAINVRTEIAYGMLSDGCTALSWKTNERSLLAQNWDWRSEQAENLIRLQIRQKSKPSIDMITEAGIIGKIGLNSMGVGVCLNAIRVSGVNYNQLPCHLALRACLDSRSRDDAERTLRNASQPNGGISSACHILLADPTGGVGLECTSRDIVSLPMSSRGVLTHTNHFIRHHSGVAESSDLPDSPFRLARINNMIESCHNDPHADDIEFMMTDEENYPASINRGRTKDSSVATLFSIVMELEKRVATVKIGRPTEYTETLTLNPMDTTITSTPTKEELEAAKAKELSDSENE